MTIYLIGTGCGAGTLTKEAENAVNGSKCLIGAERLLHMFPDDWDKTAATRQQDIVAAVEASVQKYGPEDISILFSGDTGFYSGTRRLLPLLEKYDVRILPGISSLQLFSARCRRPWQDWRLCSAHGTDCDAVKEVCRGRPVFFLTGGKLGPAQLCAQLRDAGLADLPVVIGQELGTENERICCGTAGAFADDEFAVLSVMLAEAAPRPYRRGPGLPDELFERTQRIPMTKQYIRAAVLASLCPEPDDVCWDVGSGTGSVAIELALQAGAVYSVEQNAEALELAERNRRVFGAWNLRLLQGSAPEALRDLPVPDAVFVGGSSGRLREIIMIIREKNPQARICVSAVTVETLTASVALLNEFGYETDVTQISVSRSRKAAGLHLMTAQNPVWLVTGESR